MNDASYRINFLIEEQTSLAIRLISEFVCQAREFKTDPKAYIKSSLASDSIGRKRGRLLLFGMAVGTIFLSSVMMMTALFYYSQQRTIVSENSEHKPDLRPLFYPDVIKLEAAEKSHEKSHGGGTSGNNEQQPPSFGNPPQGSMTAALVRATPHDTMSNPVLPVLPTVLAQPIPIPDALKNLPMGLRDGQPGPPSSGPGEGGGMGTSKGHGAGSGKDDGEGPGSGGNRGGGPNNGKRPGADDEEGLPFSAKMQILSRPRPDYTEEARAQKVQGVVVVEAVFKADGQIANVRVIRGLGYGLDQKAIQAVMQIKFRPAERQGRPTDVRQKISVSFQLL